MQYFERWSLAICLVLGSCAKQPMLSSERASPAEHKVIIEQAQARYERLLARFAENDRRGSWTAKECQALGTAFIGISERHQKYTHRPLETALYNAGLAFGRCGDDARAKAQFKQALQAERGFYRAQTQLVLYEYRERQAHPGARQRGIDELERIVKDSKFQDVEVLVALAALQIDRAKQRGSTDELLAARRNLQRALAINDGYLPALNQLALAHLAQARLAGGQSQDNLKALDSERARPSRQQLDLALLVVGQGLRKKPNYAPLHNSAGLIQAELGNYSAASREFLRARQLDATLLAAHMNYAALNVRFRGYREAEQAYRDALDLAPTEYEAHLGLALALRGQLSHRNQARLLPEIDRHLAQAERLAPRRPEAAFNRGILSQEVRAQTSDEALAIRELERAEIALGRFLEKAGDDPAYAAAVRNANERLDDIRDTLVWLRKGQALKRGKHSDASRGPS